MPDEREIPPGVDQAAGVDATGGFPGPPFDFEIMEWGLYD